MSDPSDDMKTVEIFLKRVKQAVENLKKRNEAMEEVDDMQCLLDALAVSFCPRCGCELTANELDRREH